MNVSGNGFAALAQMRRSIARLPEMQQAVARGAAPAVTELAVASFDAGVSVFGDAREPLKDGGARTLKKSGALRAMVNFRAQGTKVRCTLSLPYARFHIKHGILPRGGGAIPQSWNATITRIAEREFSVRMGGR